MIIFINVLPVFGFDIVFVLAVLLVVSFFCFSIGVSFPRITLIKYALTDSASDFTLSCIKFVPFSKLIVLGS